ncbi:hypothetical protein [Micromonospora musae]|uniref:Uncharacterized protein n=1 Tax=Micromonospora musae TaxID=1894970 RepID=A0A3A9XQ15_9ACTN|nr:hypothetical protein [Micromonospora musae]RKN27271.1 hypothetical protein D7044_28155 [Micromonospora musae]
MEISFSAAQVDAAPEAPPRVARPGQHIGALALAVLALAALIGAHFLPWVAVLAGSALDRLFGQDPEQPLRTYRLLDLSETAVPLYVGWLMLFGAFAAGWVKPGWRRTLLRLVCLVDLAIVFLVLDIGRPAVEASGLRASDYPRADIRSGALLALLGVLLVTAAVAALTAPVRARAERSTSQASALRPGSVSGSAAHAPEPTVGTQAPASRPPVTTGWSARPVWVPWWRRRGPITALVLGVVVAVVAAGASVWLALHRPATPRDHSGDLREFLVTAPVGSTFNAEVQASDGQLSVSQVTQLIDAGPADVFTLLGMRSAVMGGWVEPDGVSVTVTLIQFSSDDDASGFLYTYGLRTQERTGSDSTEIPGLQGAHSFVDAARDDKDRVRVDGVAQRGDVVLLITEAQPGTTDVARVNTLLRSQYDRL